MGIPNMMTLNPNKGVLPSGRGGGAGGFPAPVDPGMNLNTGATQGPNTNKIGRPLPGTPQPFPKPIDPGMELRRTNSGYPGVRTKPVLHPLPGSGGYNPGGISFGGYNPGDRNQNKPLVPYASGAMSQSYNPPPQLAETAQANSAIPTSYNPPPQAAFGNAPPPGGGNGPGDPGGNYYPPSIDVSKFGAPGWWPNWSSPDGNTGYGSGRNDDKWKEWQLRYLNLPGFGGPPRQNLNGPSTGPQKNPPPPKYTAPEREYDESKRAARESTLLGSLRRGYDPFDPANYGSTASRVSPDFEAERARAGMLGPEAQLKADKAQIKKNEQNKKWLDEGFVPPPRPPDGPDTSHYTTQQRTKKQIEWDEKYAFYNTLR